MTIKTTKKTNTTVNVVFWIAFGGLIGLGLSTFGMQIFTQESCLYLSGFFACLGAFAYVFLGKN